MRRFPSAGDDSRDQHHEHRSHTRHQSLMAARKLLQLIPRAGWPGDDRLIVQVPADVTGQAGSRGIAAALIFLQRLRRNRLDIAPVDPADTAAQDLLPESYAQLRVTGR
jgi:hypothetical protein